jgi:lysophospholipase L1-like esterase/tetratricopeptide (TPR) repeat protein
VTPQGPGRRRGALRGPLVALALLGLLLGAVEAALRLAEREPTLEEATAAAIRLRVPDGKLTVWDPDLYYRLRPGPLLAGHYPINAQGYRGPEFERAAPPGTLRIVCLGDSSTFGLTVADEDTWPAQLQRILAGLYEGSRRVEVVNVGVIGYSTEQNRRQLVRDVLPLRPDAVVLCPTAQNDATLRLGPPDEVLLERNGSLPARLSQLRVVQRLGFDFTPGDFPAGAEAVALGLRPGQPGVGPRVPPARFSENLRAMAQCARDAGVACLYVATPHDPARTAGLPDLGASEQRLIDAAQSEGVRLADVRDDFAAYAPLALTSDEVHFTPLGQRLVAIAVARALLREPPLLGRCERTPFLSAWAVAPEDGAHAHERALTTGELPPLYRRMAEGVLAPHIDQLLLGADPSIPDEFLDHDPLTGRAVERLGLGARLLVQLRYEDAQHAQDAGNAGNAERTARLAREHAEHVVPEDAFLLRTGGREELQARRHHDFALPRLLTAFDSLIGAVPLSYDLRQIAGAQAFAAGDYEQALRQFDAVLELAPGLQDVRYQRGLTLRRLGRPEQAHADFLAVVEADPGSGLGLYVDGMLALQAGERERAETSLRSAIRRDPGQFAARMMLARLLVDRDELDEAGRLVEGAAALAGDPGGVRGLQLESAARRDARGLPSDALQ